MIKTNNCMYAAWAERDILYRYEMRINFLICLTIEPRYNSLENSFVEQKSLKNWTEINSFEHDLA